MGSEVYNRIESSGIYGIRRVDLRKEFGKDVDKHLEELVSQGLVFMDKKNGAITYWSKDGYLRYILEKDPRLRLLQELMLREKEVLSKIELEDMIREMVIGIVDERVTNLNKELLKIKGSIDNIISNYSSLGNEISTLKDELNSRTSSINHMLEELDKSISNADAKLSRINSELSEKIAMLDANVRSVASNLNDEVKDIKLLNEMINELNERIREGIDASRAYVDSRLASVVNEQRSFNDDIDKRLNNLEDSIGRIESSIVSELHSRVDSITKDLLEVKSELSEKISYINEVASSVDDIFATLNTIKASVDGKNGNGNSYDTVTLEQFRIDFDRMLAESSSSIGWVELASMRERMCRRYNISAHEFYALVAQLIEHYNNRYELSSGGQEGVVIRGLIHGFVRRI